VDGYIWLEEGSGQGDWPIRAIDGRLSYVRDNRKEPFQGTIEEAWGKRERKKKTNLSF
jgi:hypothetical protein